MRIEDQGFAGYYDATLTPDATVGMGDLASWLAAGGSKFARVATNDPPPDGDLKIRSGPGTSYDQIGGAEKDAIVTILDVSEDGSWARIAWGGGVRRAPATGWASTRFLLETDEPPPFGPPPPPALPGVIIEPPAPIGPAPRPGNLKPASEKDEGIPTPVLALAGVAIVGLGIYLLTGK